MDVAVAKNVILNAWIAKEQQRIVYVKRVIFGIRILSSVLLIAIKIASLVWEYRLTAHHVWMGIS